MPARLKHALRSTGSAASGDRTPPPGVPEDPPLGGPETPPPDGPEDPPPLLGWPLMPADPIAQAEAATVLRVAREGILTLDATGRMVTCNPAFRRLTGFGLSDLSPAPVAVLLSPRNPPDLADRVREALETFARWQGRCWLRHAEGHDRAVWLSATVARDTRGAVQRYIALFTDLSHPGTDPGSLPFTRRLDPLTRLPDREALCEALALRLRTQRGGFTLALIDLDRFARINDARGRNVGDRLLRRVAARILARAGRTAYVARTGGNDFALVLEAPQGQAAETVRQVTSALQGGIDLDGERFHLPASAGLASAPLDGTTPESLLEAAEAALHHAKAEGRGRVVAFQRSMATAAMERYVVESALRRGLDGDQFCVHYQPVFRLGDGALVGAEALVRWQHPTLGLLAPAHFISVAEDCGLIGVLGQRVLAQAARQWTAWIAAAGADQVDPGAVAVNISGDQLRTGELACDIEAALTTERLPARRLIIEVTEGSLIEPVAGPRETLGAIRRLGVRVAIDDFGTGYSSLARLKTLPVDILKLDRAFVSGLPADLADAGLCRAVLDIARHLGLEVVAEGIETSAQRDWLRDAGCPLAQGYALGRPVPPEVFAATWLRRGAGLRPNGGPA